MTMFATSAMKMLRRLPRLRPAPTAALDRSGATSGRPVPACVSMPPDRARSRQCETWTARLVAVAAARVRARTGDHVPRRGQREPGAAERRQPLPVRVAGFLVARVAVDR